MIGGRRRALRRIDAWLSGRASTRTRRWAVERLRNDASLREHYDRAVEALRVLEGRAIAGAELDLVEGWLFDAPAVAGEVRRSWVRRLSMVTAVVAGAVAVVVWLPRDPQTHDPLQARGDVDRGEGLAIDVLCGRPDDDAGLQRAVDDGCALNGTLSFAYWMDPRRTGPGYLTLFGIGSDGRTLYYLPTPVDGEARQVGAGRWTPLPLTIALQVNHRRGTTRVYGLVSPQPLTVEHVDQVVAALAEQPPARLGDPSWIDRLPADTFVARMCAPTDACAAAELAFEVHEDVP